MPDLEDQRVRRFQTSPLAGNSQKRRPTHASTPSGIASRSEPDGLLPLWRVAAPNPPNRFFLGKSGNATGDGQGGSAIAWGNWGFFCVAHLPGTVPGGKMLLGRVKAAGLIGRQSGSCTRPFLISPESAPVTSQQIAEKTPSLPYRAPQQSHRSLPA